MTSFACDQDTAEHTDSIAALMTALAQSVRAARLARGANPRPNPLVPGYLTADEQREIADEKRAELRAQARREGW